MSIIPLGSQASSTAKTPTLKQYLKEVSVQKGEAYPVTIIFLPNKFPNITLICGNCFKVTIGIADALYGLINLECTVWARDMATLMLVVTDESKGSFRLGIDADKYSTWFETDYGYHLDELATTKEEYDKKSTLDKTPKKTRKPKGTSTDTSEDF